MIFSPAFVSMSIVPCDAPFIVRQDGIKYKIKFKNMSVISKDLAHQISTKLTEKSRIAAEKLHVEYREVVTIFYEEQTPQEVKALHKKFPDWFYERGSVQFHGNGFSWESVCTTRQIICNGGTSANLVLNSKIADKIMSAKRKWEKQQAIYKALKDEAKQALLTLKTFNNIRKELPEAAPLLPPPLSNALVVNFSSLKSRLHKQPDVAVEAKTKPASGYDTLDEIELMNG